MKATRIPNEADPYQQGGYIVRDDALVVFCPGCDNKAGYRLAVEAGTNNPDRFTWGLTWRQGEPTLHGSFVASHCCGWHGYLQDGNWRIT